MKISIPYAKTHLEFEIPDGTDAEILRSKQVPVPDGVTQDQLVLDALAHPIGSPGLAELAQGKKTAVVICSDHTRPVPSRQIIPHLLAELRRGNPQIDVTLLVATGCHRGTTRAELTAKFGEEIVGREKIIVHDCLDAASLVEIGTLPSGAKLVINKTAAEADLLVSEGFIEPHFFAGFSGGRKSVLPGICGRTTVLGNHCAGFIADAHARTGVLAGNPLHRDMVAAAQMARLAFIANVLINEKKEAVAAFAGEPCAAHEKGCEYLARFASVRPARLADIVITSNGGYPLDQNVYQSVKGLTAAEAAAAPGAVLITCASCADGAGGEGFYQALANCRDAQSLLDGILKVPQDETAPDQWEVQILARMLAKHRVIFVADRAAAELLRGMKLTCAATLEEAFAMAVRAKGQRAKVTVIPDGVSVIVQA